MRKQITINPITRVSGFLEIQVEVENNVVVDAKSSGMLFRGFERMLQGRPPLDAIYFTQRICGICSTAHSMASSWALEDALGIEPNENDRMLRDFLHGCEFLQNHIRHFYQYGLPDFVKGPDIAPLIPVEHRDFRLPDRLNRELGKHYLESLKYSRLAHEMLATLGGKAPHNHGIFAGGVTVNLNMVDLLKVKSILKEIRAFIEEKMLYDINVLAEHYADYFNLGGGYGNLLSYGVFDYGDRELFYVSPGVWMNGARMGLDEGQITENVYRAWYEAAEIERRPLDSMVQENAYKAEAYTWVKAPRYDGRCMEVGPLARMWLSGRYMRGISMMDRIIARVLEAQKIAGIMEELLERVALEPAKQRDYRIPQKAVGRGFIDTTRGALGHWISIEDRKIKNYEIITPTAWNLSPEDAAGQKGTMERALMGTPIADVNEPVEIGRIIRSFDPCVSCATHVFGKQMSSVEIRIQ